MFHCHVCLLTRLSSSKKMPMPQPISIGAWGWMCRTCQITITHRSWRNSRSRLKGQWELDVARVCLGLWWTLKTLLQLPAAGEIGGFFPCRCGWWFQAPSVWSSVSEHSLHHWLPNNLIVISKPRKSSSNPWSGDVWGFKSAVCKKKSSNFNKSHDFRLNSSFSHGFHHVSPTFWGPRPANPRQSNVAAFGGRLAAEPSQLAAAEQRLPASWAGEVGCCCVHKG